MEPKEFNQLVKNLNEQDNRLTAAPLFCVQQKRRVYGLDSEYSDKWVWLHQEDQDLCYENTEELWRALCDPEAFDLSAEDYAAIRDMDETDLALADDGPSFFTVGDELFNKVYYHEYFEFVNAHFTAAAAERYISENSYNLREPRVYVTSQYRCPEWIGVVAALKNQGMGLVPALQFSREAATEKLAVAMKTLKEIHGLGVDNGSKRLGCMPEAKMKRLAEEASVVIEWDPPSGLPRV